jgi:hypothetical protein
MSMDERPLYPLEVVGAHEQHIGFDDILKRKEDIRGSRQNLDAVLLSKDPEGGG